MSVFNNLSEMLLASVVPLAYPAMWGAIAFGVYYLGGEAMAKRRFNRMVLDRLDSGNFIPLADVLAEHDRAMQLMPAEDRAAYEKGIAEARSWMADEWYGGDHAKMDYAREGKKKIDNAAQ
jgi:hypothetical protein